MLVNRLPKILFQPWLMRRAIATSALLLAVWIGACEHETAPTATSPSSEETASSTSPQSPETGTEPSPTPTIDPASRVISATGIGQARLGMTLGELKQELGSAEFTAQSPFMVDFDAIAVRQNGEVQFYVLYLAGQPFTDTDVIQGLLTDNSAYKTAEDVGPGTPIEQAEQAYGEATLSYNTENESREYVRFVDQPASNLSFATGNGNAQPAGVYANPIGGYNETQDYRPDATIQSILVVCLDEACAGDQ